MIKYLYMQAILRTRLLLFATGLILIPAISAVFILFARGYRPNFQKKTLQPTGLLVSSSVPDGAQIYLNGNLATATNSTINLSPGTYQVEIKKEAFQPWKKTLVVSAEIVTRAQALLFPSVPSLKAITTIGATRPTLSPDGTKVAFLSNSSLYTLDLSESPLGIISRDPKLISNLPAGRQVSNLLWSPDSRQILAIASSSAFLVDSVSPQSPSSASASLIASNWLQRRREIDAQKFIALPPPLQSLLATAAADLSWSPKENRLLYTATASATLPDQLKKPLPGSNSQLQERHLKPRFVYIYDLEEDRNFKIAEIIPIPTPTPSKNLKIIGNLKIENSFNGGWTWFPDSAHIIKVEDKKIIISEYDGQNSTTIYAGPMDAGFAAPYPSGKQVLILTNLTPSASVLPNLYAISLR